LGLEIIILYLVYHISRLIINLGTNLRTPRPTTTFKPLGVTRYYADDIIDEIRSEFAIKCWESIRNKIVLTPVHYISNLFSEVENILHFMKDIKVDCSSIRKMVTKVIEDVKMFIHIKSLPSLMMTSV